MNSSYFDCNATTPIEPDVANFIQFYTDEYYGNAGSRTHELGTRAKQAVQKARVAIAYITCDKPDSITFTSGATESNNLAILGLGSYGEETGKKHIISTAIEHKAVLEPLAHLSKRGWDITLVPCDSSGRVCPEAVANELRDDTLLVTVMHANNETGIIQPIEEIAALLTGHDAYFHVDAAQTFGKLFEPLQNSRIDMISASAHKVYGPKGVGALITRRRRFKRPPLQPLMFGGGQEKGLRPGTLPVPLIAGFGKAAELALENCEVRKTRCLEIRASVEKLVDSIGGEINGDPKFCLQHVLNFSIPGVNSEAAMVALKGVIAISNGSACTSSNYEPSHVLTAMGLPEDQIAGALRFSWCHMTEEPNWSVVHDRLVSLM